MAKTIMVSNEVYRELKVRKAKRSFSELIMNMLSKKERTGSGLRACLGLLKEDAESKIIDKALKRGWKSWNKRYA